CVGLRYGRCSSSPAAFLGSVKSMASPTIYGSPSQLMVLQGGFACPDHSLLGRALPVARSIYPTASPHHSNGRHRYRNFCLLPIAYASLPRLRSRLTQSGRAFLWKPWSFGGRDSHPSFATHTRLPTSNRSTSPRGPASPPPARSSTTQTSVSVHSVGNVFSPGTFSAQRRLTSELLRTLSMLAASTPTS